MRRKLEEERGVWWKPALFGWNACNFEETEEKRLVFSEFFLRGMWGLW